MHLDNIIQAPFIKRKNAKQLRDLTVIVRTSLQNLKILNQPVEYWNAILIKLVVDKLDVETLEKWKMSRERERERELFVAILVIDSNESKKPIFSKTKACRWLRIPSVFTSK